VQTCLTTARQGIAADHRLCREPTATDRPGLSDKVIRDILGHEGKDVHDKTYSKPAPVARLREAIEVLPVVF
jgi:hypothetical protein